MAELRAQVYLSMGIWVTKCPRPWCVHVDHYGPGPTTGRIGGLTRTYFHCLRCGLKCDAEWPANVEDILAVVAQRPMYETRNWLPGETIEDLLMENVMHGLIDPAAIPAGLIALDGQLAPGVRRLVAASPLAIGG